MKNVIQTLIVEVLRTAVVRDTVHMKLFAMAIKLREIIVISTKNVCPNFALTMSVMKIQALLQDRSYF